MKVKFNLTKEMFHPVKRRILEAGEFKAEAFCYASGVCALEVSNTRCSYIFLPFDGQEIWRYRVDGEEMTMKSMFEEPEDTQDFESSYGAFLIHCGLTAMGNPSDDDPHPLHGELPLAHYNEAGWAHSLQVRPDGKACYVSFDTTYLLTGVRWISHTGEEEACGFCLPNTGNHKGKWLNGRKFMTMPNGWCFTRPRFRPGEREGRGVEDYEQIYTIGQ